MEPLWKLLYLLEPSSVTLFVTAIVVLYASASKALNYGKEMERNHDLSEASITLDTSQALMIPIMSSCSLLFMFYIIQRALDSITFAPKNRNRRLILYTKHGFYNICPKESQQASDPVRRLIFGANVMVSVATQQASNPVHTVANSLSLPGLQLITRKLELPVKIVFPRNMVGGALPGNTTSDYMMLGLGDMINV
ncbi:signal peptide peptidase-like 1 [Orobanche hederae]